MYRLLDVEDVEFLKRHGAKTNKFSRRRSQLFHRFLNALDREIETSLRQRLLHENWDMMQLAREKFWVRGQIWRLRLSAAAFALGIPADAYQIREQLANLMGLAGRPVAVRT
jgi:hypothetical protein